MANFQPGIGQPIRSLQVFLRQISNEWGNIPMVIPDGIYGESTYLAVKAFQEQSGLPATGETNSETWNALRQEYENIMCTNCEPKKMAVYPGANHIFPENESSIYLFPIQAILHVIATVYPELGKLNINGVCDKSTCSMVKNIQQVCGCEASGVLNKEVWNMLTGMYENLVARNRFYG